MIVLCPLDGRSVWHEIITDLEEIFWLQRVEIRSTASSWAANYGAHGNKLAAFSYADFCAKVAEHNREV